VKAVLLAVIVLLGLLSGGSYWWEHRVVEPFSELGILGPNQVIGGYPTSLVVNESFTLYLYVGNHEGHVMYYDIRVKLGDNSSVVNDTVSLDAPIMEDYRVLLVDGQNWTQPITLSIGETGTDLRLVFEMWTYNTTVGDFTYHDIWDQLWMNISSSS
jgi:uncharacterized membrane protein